MIKIVIIPVLAFALYNCTHKQPPATARMYDVTRAVVDTPSKHLYRSLSSFKDDTLAYIKYNYITNKAAYLGRPLKTLFNSLETPIYKYIPGSPYDYYDKSNDVPYMRIYIYPNVEERIREKKNPALLVLHFNKPIMADSIELLRKKTLSKWTNDAVKFFEHKVIRDITIVRVDF